jgi:Ni/Co efflux regulator RcnB
MTKGDVMKTIIALLVAVCFVAMPVTALAGKGGSKGPSAKAQGKADDNASFKRKGEADETGEQYQKKERKRVEATEGAEQGQGATDREKKRERKEGTGDD